MRVFAELVALVLFAPFLLAGCSMKQPDLGPKKESRAYETRTVETGETPVLDLDMDYGSIEIFTWGKGQIRFEATKRVRAPWKAEVLEKELDRFSLSLEKDEERVSFKGRYKGRLKSPGDIALDLKVYMPQETRSLKIKLDTGKIQIHDDLFCELSIETAAANTVINRLTGSLRHRGDMGNLVLKGGVMEGECTVSVNFGNIEIRSDFLEGGNYDIKAGAGNVDLKIPAHARVKVAASGDIKTNQFEGVESDTEIKVNSGMGRITVEKYGD